MNSVQHTFFFPGPLHDYTRLVNLLSLSKKKGGGALCEQAISFGKPYKGSLKKRALK